MNDLPARKALGFVCPLMEADGDHAGQRRKRTRSRRFRNRLSWLQAGTLLPFSPKSLIVLLTAMCATAGFARTQDISLAGSWRFELDRTDSGIQEKWFTRALTGKVP